MTNTWNDNQILYFLYVLFVAFLFLGMISSVEKEETSSMRFVIEKEEKMKKRLIKIHKF